jgi:RNA polymerase sigma-70 factor (ECF subfamily)
MVAVPRSPANRLPASLPETVPPPWDAVALESLIDQHADRWFAVARRMLGSDHDAADALQEAYVSALGAADQFRGESLPSTWVHRIIVNSCLTKLRSRRKTISVEMDECFASLPERDRLVADETRDIVHECIARLPRLYRDVLVMRDLEEQSTHDTARMLRMAPGAVKTRLHRARRALRTLIEESVGEEHFAVGA